MQWPNGLRGQNSNQGLRTRLRDDGVPRDELNGNPRSWSYKTKPNKQLVSKTLTSATTVGNCDLSFWLRTRVSAELQRPSMGRRLSPEGAPRSNHT